MICHKANLSIAGLSRMDDTDRTDALQMPYVISLSDALQSVLTEYHVMLALSGHL